VSSGEHKQRDSQFSSVERDAVYKCIATRRDVRSQFLPDAIPDEILARILRAAHQAPSVGFMQPWDFLVIRDAAVRQRIKAAFEAANRQATEMFADERQRLYRTLKLEGIVEAPLGICITCDRNRTGPVGLGRTHQPDMDVYSTVCAIQNLWLAARAENIGVGWVSIIRIDDLRAALGIPAEIDVIAYLCLGYVSDFLAQPELEAAGWLPRLPLDELVWFDQWRGRAGSETLLRHLKPSERHSESE
jgi:5,6-dimethylbenzimidazole synthase